MFEKALSDMKFGKNFVPTLDVVGKALPKILTDKKLSQSIKYYNFIEIFKAKKCKNKHYYFIIINIKLKKSPMFYSF